MSDLEREVRRQRRLLLRHDERVAAELGRNYSMVYRRLSKRIDELERAIALTDAPRVSDVVRLEQHRTLLTEAEREIWAFGRQATEIVANGQRTSLAEVNANSWRLTELALGASPRSARAALMREFIGLSSEALARYVGFAADGGPLADLFSAIAPDSVRKLRDTIAYGLTTGKHPSEVARDVRKVAQMPLHRANTISRTEMLRAYNSAAIESYGTNEAVVTGWTWVAALTTRTCSACWAMHGTEHTNEESLDGHPRCRCTPVPRTKSWREMGFDIDDNRPTFTPGGEQFMQLPASDQRLILGPGKYDALTSGEISFDDLMTRSHSPRWGTTRREASLTEARQAAAA